MGQVARGLLVRLGDLRGQRARRDPSRQPDPFRRGAGDGRPNPAVSAHRPGRGGRRFPRLRAGPRLPAPRRRPRRLGVGHGRIPTARSCWSAPAGAGPGPTRRHYLGSNTPGDTAHLHFPGISREAAEWLARQRKVYGVGIDTASLDHGPSRTSSPTRSSTAPGSTASRTSPTSASSPSRVPPNAAVGFFLIR